MSSFQGRLEYLGGGIVLESFCCALILGWIAGDLRENGISTLGGGWFDRPCLWWGLSVVVR